MIGDKPPISHTPCLTCTG